jgi:hypothetical protein
MPYRIGSNTIITEGDATPASANASFRNFFYRYSLNPATYVGTVGTNYGYITGGVTSLQPGGTGYPGQSVTYYWPIYYGASASFTNNVERFPFAGLINTVQVSGSLSTTRASFASQSSKTAGYSSGGYITLPPATPGPGFYQNVTASTVIDSFPFISMGIITVSSAGSLSSGRFGCTGHQSDIEGFTSSGATSNTAPAGVSTIDKFPFASFITASSTATLSVTRLGHAGHSSAVSGFVSGGFSPHAFLNTTPQTPVGTSLTNISRFPFSVNPATSTSVSNLTTARGYNVGVSSTTNGYTYGGSPTGFTYLTSIERFNFSEQTVTSAVNPATLSSIRGGASGVNSTEYGYICGGFQGTAGFTTPFPSPTAYNFFAVGGLQSIEIFPFASTTTTAGSLNMTTGKGNIGGNQY